MKEQNLTSNESLDLITQMIARTRQRLERGSGNQLLFWGYLVVAVTILVNVAGYFLRSPKTGWIYFLIPIIGLPVSWLSQKRSRENSGVVSYSDYLTNSLWNIVIGIAVASVLVCLGFLIVGFPVWIVMMLFGFFVIGMAITMQGVIIREKSLVIGGSVGIIIGGFLTAGYISGAGAIMGMFVTPMFIITYIVMMIIPGYILNHKARKNKDERA